MTTSRSRGNATVTSLRLCSRAPRTTSWSWGMTLTVYATAPKQNARSHAGPRSPPGGNRLDAAAPLECVLPQRWRRGGRQEDPVRRLHRLVTDDPILGAGRQRLLDLEPVVAKRPEDRLDLGAGAAGKDLAQDDRPSTENLRSSAEDSRFGRFGVDLQQPGPPPRSLAVGIERDERDVDGSDGVAERRVQRVRRVGRVGDVQRRDAIVIPDRDRFCVGRETVEPGRPGERPGDGGLGLERDDASTCQRRADERVEPEIRTDVECQPTPSRVEQREEARDRAGFVPAEPGPPQDSADIERRRNIDADGGQSSLREP